MPYVKPNSQRKPTSHLFIGNVGPLWGINADDIRRVLQPFCTADGDSSNLDISAPDEKAHFWNVSFRGPNGVAEASTALQALSGKPCAALQDKVPICRYSKWLPDEGSTDEQEQQSCSQPVAFTTEQANIPGLYIFPDFISEQEEQQLLQHIDQQPWQYLAKRRVQHYGYKFEYTQRGVDLRQQVGAIPCWSQPLVQRLQELPDVPVLDQITVNEYTPGVGIAPHVDAHSSFTGAILSLSLLGGCIMTFRRGYTVSPEVGGQQLTAANATRLQQQQHEQQQQEQDQVLVYLAPRTLLVMSGEARYGWQHYIPHRKSDLVNGQLLPRAARRVSLTFRKVRGFPCSCSFPECCDSQDGALPPPRSSLLTEQQQQQEQVQHQEQQQEQQQQQQQQHADGSQQQQQQSNGQHKADRPQEEQQQQQHVNGQQQEQEQLQPGAVMEDVHVHQVYDAIASHFSSTRFAVWPKVRAFLESLAPGSVVADVGCGNGKYFGVRPDLAVLGCDRSAGLAAVAAQRLSAGATASVTSRGGQTATVAAADVFVCDAMQLAYRTGSCDAVLCIAVLHHMSSRQRRLALLRQLAAVLRPGGRGLVTVWATQQEDPAKTIQRWQKIQQGSTSELQQDQQQLPLQDSGSCCEFSTGEVHQQQQQQQEQQQMAAAAAAGVIEGPDYFVPWHLPFHKAGALAASNQQQQQHPEANGAAAAVSGNVYSTDGGQKRGTELSAGAAGVAGVRVDQAKGAVVLQRYYHLFEQGELESLVADVPGLKVVQSFYDRSNWCVEMEKQE